MRMLLIKLLVYILGFNRPKLYKELSKWSVEKLSINPKMSVGPKLLARVQREVDSGL